MEQDQLNFKERLDQQDATLEEILVSVKKTETRQKISFWVTLIVVVLPLLAALVVVPMAIRSYLSTFEGLL